MDSSSVLINLVCNNCSKQYFVTNGVHFGNCIITSGAAIMNHLKTVHTNYSSIYKQFEHQVIKLNYFNITPFLLVPANNKQFKRASFINFGACIWRSPEIYEDLKTLLISPAGLNTSLDNNRKKSFLEFSSYFIIIRTNAYEINVPKFQIKNYNKGEEVLTVHTPFMSVSLYKCWSKGSICNILGNTLLLIDSRLTVGCEGAPVFLFRNGKKGALIALTIWNILNDDDSNSGFTIASTLPSIFQRNSSFSSLFQKQNILSETVDETSIVKVCVDEVWGSGVIISEDGVIVTCAHVIKFNQKSLLNVLVSVGGKSYSSRVLFCTNKYMSCELAVLIIEHSYDKFKAVPLALTEIKCGEKVKAIGYNIFSNVRQACATSGIISKVTPYFVVSTCLVHEGASGGALLDSQGKLLGIITYNLRCDSNNEHTVIPYINFSIPTHSFGNYLVEFLNKRDINPLVKWSRSVPLDAVEMHSFQLNEIPSLIGKL